MKQIKVYGAGCKGCNATYEKFIATADDLNLTIEIEKITSLEAIMTAGILTTPAVVIDEQLVHSGSIPDDKAVAMLLSKA